MYISTRSPLCLRLIKYTIKIKRGVKNPKHQTIMKKDEYEKNIADLIASLIGKSIEKNSIKKNIGIIAVRMCKFLK